MPYQCDSGDSNPVVMIITNQVEAETNALCAECFLTWVDAAFMALHPETFTASELDPTPDAAADYPALPPDAPAPVAPGVDADTDEATDDDGAQDTAEPDAKPARTRPRKTAVPDIT